MRQQGGWTRPQSPDGAKAHSYPEEPPEDRQSKHAHHPMRSLGSPDQAGSHHQDADGGYRQGGRAQKDHQDGGRHDRGETEPRRRALEEVGSSVRTCNA